MAVQVYNVHFRCGLLACAMSLTASPTKGLGLLSSFLRSFAIASCILLAPSSYAEPVQAPLPWGDAEQKAADPVATLRRVERYLNDITTMTANFTQISADGSLATGKLYIQRPGKMRWEYAPPVPVVMVSNGESLTYYDKQLDQLTALPLDDNMVTFLTRPMIKLDDDAVRIVDFREGAGSIRFTILQTAKQQEGALTLELLDGPLRLKQIAARDTLGQTTSIKLEDVIYDQRLDASLFKTQKERAFRGTGK